MRKVSFKCPKCKQYSLRSTYIFENGKRIAICRSCGGKKGDAKKVISMMEGTDDETMKKIAKDVQDLPYVDWIRKHPNYAHWLADNGFVYVQELDKHKG